MQPSPALAVARCPVSEVPVSNADQPIGEVLIGCTPVADLHMHHPLWPTGRPRLLPVFVCQQHPGTGLHRTPRVLARRTQAQIRYLSLTIVILGAKSLLNTASLTDRHVIESSFGCGDRCSCRSRLQSLPAAQEQCAWKPVAPSQELPSSSRQGSSRPTEQRLSSNHAFA